MTKTRKKCVGCDKIRASFGNPDDTKAQYCKNCKKDGMIDIVHHKYKCIVCDKTRASFGNPNDTKAQYCKNCKNDGMIDIINNHKCIGCDKKMPHFGLPTDKKAQYCRDCKKDGMIDIHNPKCIGCNKKIPHFGLPTDKKAQYCKDCKKDGMINIKSPKCIGCDKKIPNYGYKTDKKAQYCADCKKDEMIDIVHPICKSEWCSTIIKNKKYDGYCAYCYRHIFPDKPTVRNYKTKETSVYEYIKNNFFDIDIISDKIIQGGCSKKRPDILIDLGYQIIIVEIDENQHTDYNCSCENKRIMELSQDIDHRPIVFIRFNPDKYKTNSKNITSCWGKNKSGVYTITKNKEWNKRLNTLQKTINYWIKNITNKTIEIVHLYYDE